jgi:hypothetical protein
MKWFFIIIGVIGCLFLVNAYVPSAWASGFKVPVGPHGMLIPWAVCILLAVIVAGVVKLKSA